MKWVKKLVEMSTKSNIINLDQAVRFNRDLKYKNSDKYH